MAEDVPHVKRTGEIEEATNRYVIHPVSRAAVTRFARWGLSPNAVSLLGLGLGAAAAVAYYHYRYGAMAWLGLLLMVGWHVMDGADGQLARLTGRSSELGKVLDGVCDYGTFVLVYLALALATAPALGAWVWGAAALAGISHAMQAGAYEFQRGAYDFWGHGRRSARPEPPAARRASLREQHGLARLFGSLHGGYLWLQHRVAAVDEPLQEKLAAALRRSGSNGASGNGASGNGASGNGASGSEARIRAGYRTFQRGGVRRWSLLCSNYRTLAIFLACLAGVPVLFFAFEIVVLNAAFLLLVRAQKKRNRALRSWLAEQAPRPAATPRSEPLPTESTA